MTIYILEYTSSKGKGQFLFESRELATSYGNRAILDGDINGFVIHKSEVTIYSGGNK